MFFTVTFKANHKKTVKVSCPVNGNGFRACLNYLINEYSIKEATILTAGFSDKDEQAEGYFNDASNFDTYADFPPDGYFTNDEARHDAEQTEQY